MKKTERYGLNLFEGSDRLRTGPVNENAVKLEAALERAAAGGLVAVKIQSSCVWTAPRAAGQLFKVFVVGAGGGGISYIGSYGGGGGSGHIVIKELTLAQGEEIEVVCGAGGASSDTGGAEGGATSFGAYVTAPGGKGGTTTAGGDGGAGGGGANGGAGGAGQFGGGGGGGGVDAAGGAGGPFGGAGGSYGGAATDGTPFGGSFADILFRCDLTMDGRAGVWDGNGTVITAPGSGGYGGRGGDSQSFGGGGGGGCCGNGGRSYTAGGGGGGGYCGNGGNSSFSQGVGGGGGGFFCDGGAGYGTSSASYVYGGGGGGFFSPGGTEKANAGGDGGVLIMYYKGEDETA